MLMWFTLQVRNRCWDRPMRRVIGLWSRQDPPKNSEKGDIKQCDTSQTVFTVDKEILLFFIVFIHWIAQSRMNWAATKQKKKKISPLHNRHFFLLMFTNRRISLPWISVRCHLEIALTLHTALLYLANIWLTCYMVIQTKCLKSQLR